MNAEAYPIAKFRLGRIVATANAVEVIPSADITAAITRHLAGDWGEMDGDDRQTNERALMQGGRLVSIYHSAKGVKFYLITEADRRVTTVLLPEDY
jgi:hypothetical protein